VKRRGVNGKGLVGEQWAHGLKWAFGRIADGDVQTMRGFLGRDVEREIHPEFPVGETHFGRPEMSSLVASRSFERAAEMFPVH
jgi:hypothetical protein